MVHQILKYLTEDYPWLDKIIYYDIIDSTNTRLKQMASQGAPHGTVLIADQQTGGRGRMGRSFLSPPDLGVYISLLLRPDCSPSDLMHLTCLSACAACDAVEKAAGFRPEIKWTNDLVYRKRKLAGILTELGLNMDGSLDYAIIGIGVNCCHVLSDFPEELQSTAGSLSMFSERPIDRSIVAAEILNSLYRMSSISVNDSAWVERYRKDCITLGQEISVVRSETIRHGKALDIDSLGALLVQYSTGEIEKVNSGEVSIRGMYGYL